MKRRCKLFYLIFLIASSILAKEPVSLLLIPLSPWERAGGLETAYLSTQYLRQVLISSGWFQVQLYNEHSPEVAQARDNGVLSDMEASKPERNPLKIGELFEVDIVIWGKIANVVEKDDPPQAIVELEINLMEVKTKEKETFKVKGEAKGEATTSKQVVLERALYSACYAIQDKLITRELSNITDVRREQAETMKQEADKLLSEGKEREAIAKLEEASLVDPSNHTIYIALGNCYLKLGDFRKAERQFRMALSLSKTDEQAFIGLAKALKGRNQINSAIAQLRVLLYFFPKSKEGKLLLAQYLRKTGNNEEASQILQDLARDFPDDPDIQWEVGESYLNRRQLASAYAYFKASFSNKPSPEKANSLAKLALSLGRYQELFSIMDKWVALIKDKMTSSDYINVMNIVDELISNKLTNWTNIRNGILSQKISKEVAVDTIENELKDIDCLKSLLENIIPPSDFKKSYSTRRYGLTTLRSAFVALNSYIDGLGDEKLQLADVLIDSAKRDLALAKFLEGR